LSITGSSGNNGAVVKAAAAIVMAVRNSQHAVNRAHRAADAGADCAADHPADRAGNPVALRRAFVRAAHDALGIPKPGHRQQCQSDRRNRNITSRRQIG